jgi:hypothetical protein
MIDQLGKSDITVVNEVATIEQLEAISSDPAFVFSQFRSKATYLQAVTEHCRILEEENRRLKADFPAQLAQARQQAADESWAEFEREQASQRAVAATESVQC